jgi:Beta/Gamma crystallin
MAEIVLFQHINFRGVHKHLYGSEPNLAAPDDNQFNDLVSSFVITSGSWQFFTHVNFTGPASNVFGPGRYNWVENVGIPNDSVSSVRRVA